MAHRSRAKKHSSLPRKHRASRRHLLLQQLDRRELLASDPPLGGLNPQNVSETAPRLISINPNAGEIFSLDGSNLLSYSPSELIFRFDGSQRLDANTLQGIRITRAGGDGSFVEGNEQIIQPGYLGFGESERIVIARFSNPLVDDRYQIHIFGFDLPGAGIVGLRNTNGELYRPENPAADREEVFFEVEIGALVTAVVPQPIENVGGTLVQRRDTIHVYFNEDPLSDPALGPISTPPGGATPLTPSVVNPSFYKLYATGETVENTDDTFLEPVSVTYDPAINRAVLNFVVPTSDPMAPGNDLSNWSALDGTQGAGTLRLRIGSSNALPTPPVPLAIPANETLAGAPGDAFATARALGTLFDATGKSVEISSHISPVSEYLLRWPGSGTEPGVRNIRPNSQIVSRGDTQSGIATLYYNFKNQYGDDIQGNRLNNAITPAQKQRVREVLDLYEQHLGVRFVETLDRGLHIVTGDMRAIDKTATIVAGGNLSIFRSDDTDPGVGVLVMDGAENWYDGYGQSPEPATRPSWFLEALRQIGSMLGIGDLFDRPPGTAAGSEAELAFNLLTEPDFLSQSDITLGQYLFRPESRDVDLYSFSLAESGTLTAETFAERLENSSLLDTALTLWKRHPGGAPDDYELIARNNDFYSKDSFIGLAIDAGDYMLGVSAAGNESYNPKVANSGLGGTSEGSYKLRLNYVAAVTNSIKDISGTALDGDADGVPGGNYNFWFRTAKVYDPATDGALSTSSTRTVPRTIFVNKTGTDSNVRGTLAQPLKTIDVAMGYAISGDIIRLLPNAGNDGRFDTLGDNFGYEIGRGGVGNAELADGLNVEVKRGVTVMVDAGAILKLRSAQISVGSSSIDTDRSLGAFQVLGTPLMVNAAGVPITVPSTGARIPGSVIFTSYDDQNVGYDGDPLQTTPAAGHWGGISFRNDVDYGQGRPVAELEGIFLNHVGHADIRYGGGAVGSRVVTPIEMNESRPTVQYSIFRNNADAALSADPNSFEESNFHGPLFQRAALFTSDYDRVGPDLRGNQFENNSINGLFVRIDTPSAGQLEPMSVSGRFDDRDITHVVSQQLIVQGTPGGPQLETILPSVLSVTVTAEPATTGFTSTLAPGTYNYRLTFVDIDGGETLPSLPSRSATVAAGQQVRLAAIPTAPGEYVGRRLYRLDPATGNYVFVTQLNKSQQTYTDRGATRGGLLDSALFVAGAQSHRARLDARLSVDAGVIIKLQTARIETTFGADFYAEGLDGFPIVFTSRQDDRYGAGGNFDTNNDGRPGAGGAAPQPADWSGLIFGQGSSGSLDYSLVTFAGGNASIEGTFANFNPVEVVQAKVRIAHSTFENNASGLDSSTTRVGRGFNDAATLFVRGAQPIILDNVFRNNAGSAISINPDALNFANVTDPGRGTGHADLWLGSEDNQGPLIRNNRLSGNTVNGMRIRPEVMTTEGVWDDADIVHVVGGSVIVADHHYVGGLRLESNPNQSLVVKFQSGGRLYATGRPLDISDRIGGTLQVVGQPGFPVILTSIRDDSVGAGFTPDGRAQTDTNGDENATRPAPGDWQGIVLDVFANDRNVEVILESEPALATAAEQNAIPGRAQFVGTLSAGEKLGDENERLGFNINGALASDSDIDVYSFLARGGTEVWIDVDRTTYSLDTVVELIDLNGNIQVLSDNSFTEQSNSASIYRDPDTVANLAYSLNKNGGRGQTESPNERDAGFRVILPGAAEEKGIYFVRVRSSNLAPGESAAKLLDPEMVREGRSRGAYRLGLRLREADEVAGSTVQLADIRYAVNGVELASAPLHSPLTGEAAEALTLENNILVDRNNAELTGVAGGPDVLGNLLSTDRGAITVTGRIGNQSLILNPNSTPAQDFDIYEFDVRFDSLEPSIATPDARYASVTFDIDYADAYGRVNTSLAIYDAQGRLILIGRDSNVAGDVGTPLRGVDAANLDAGSAGVLDAYIGPVELPEGRYSVVVHSDVTMPTPLSQFVSATSITPLTRVVPTNAIRQIASDGVDEHIVPPIFPLPNVQQLDYPAEQAQVEFVIDSDALVPYFLEDVNLFVASTIPGNPFATRVSVFDPFTGTFERTIGNTPFPIRDLDFRNDGELYGYSIASGGGVQDNANTGNYLNISSQTANVLNNSDDGITFQRNNENGDGMEADDDAQLIINAVTFQRNTSSDVFLVGTRDTAGRGEVQLRQNILYRANRSTGAINNCYGGPDRTFDSAYTEAMGPASQKFECGIIDTGLYGGPGAGGTITGIAIDPVSPQYLYAVDDRGGAYLVNLNGPPRQLNTSSPGVYALGLRTSYLGTITALPEHTLGFLRFSGLSLGPLVTEGGRYRQTLFASTSDGWMYSFAVNKEVVNPFAFDEHVFVNGRRAIRMVYGDGSPVAISPVGIAFSSLESNPWRQTTLRGSDPGHGVGTAYDSSRSGGSGGQSMYFGFNDGVLEVPEGDARTLAPGGAHGSLMTQPFSLKGYSPADKPTAYFSYFLESEGSNGPSITDSARVFAAGDDGEWRLLATNNSLRSRGTSDEYDYFSSTGIPVQELFENTNGWRQARVDISPLAGHETVRLRFDFSTAGSMRFSGFPGYRTEIMAVPGNKLTDGDTLVLQDSLDPFAPPVVFEVDLGYVIEVPSGAEIRIGDSFNVTFGATTQTVVFTAGPAGPGQARVTPNMTSSQVADAVLNALNPAINAVLFSQASIGLTAATGVNVSGAAASGVAVVGVRGIDPASDQAIIVEGNLSTNQVALRIREAFVRQFGDVNATVANYKTFAGRVFIHNYTLVERGPFGGITGTPGDEFGNFESGLSFPAIDTINQAAGLNNEIEGFFIDDLIIGFAERGEMVFNAPLGNLSFISNPESDPTATQPERPFEVTTGPYSLELRTSSYFGVPDDGVPNEIPPRLLLNEDLGLGRSFDTNDRLDSAVTIMAQGGGQIREGDTFVLTDGTRQMTFEFDSVVSPGVQPGRVAVPFDPRRDLDTDVARSIRNAINSQQVQLVLDIRAESGDSSELLGTTSNRVELFGNAVFVNPSVGRNLKVDLVDAENFRDRVAAETIPQVPIPDGPVDYVLSPDTFARALPTDYLDGTTDTLVAVGKIGDRATLDELNRIILTDNPRNDIDIIKIHLYAGNSIDIDIDARTVAKGAQRLTLPWILVHDANQVEVASSMAPGSTGLAPGESVPEAFIRFVAPSTGYYYVSVTTEPDPLTGLPATFGDYQLTIRPSSDRNDVLYIDYHLDFGDTNRFRDQGQFVISSNFISDSAQWGVLAIPSNRDRTDISDLSGTLLPKPGNARLLRNENSARLIPGSVISNNVIVAGGTGGILFTGDPSPLGSMPGSVPFGRIVNNTVVGGPATGDIGIDVGINASPTVINNVISEFTVGLRVHSSLASQSTVADGNIYRFNQSASNFPLGSSSYNLDLPAFPNKALFTDASGRVFIPANQSLAIDSSFAELQDREAFFNTIKEPVGIGISSIVAPSFDAYGQPRIDDPLVQTPGGVGENVFIDRGALDRADFFGPLARIAVPVDFISGLGQVIVGGDFDGTPTYLKLQSGVLQFFEIQLLEPQGSGPNAATIRSEGVILTENGRRMVEGVDYVFGFSDSSNIIRLTPLSGIWRPDATYEITLNNRDRLVVQAPSGDQVVDGQQVIITDDTGVRAFLEYDTGYVMDVPQTLTLVVPVGEGGASGFRDGDQFEVRSPSGTVRRFELNVFGDVSSPSVVEIPLAPASTATQVRDAILAALLSTTGPLNIAPAAVGTNQIHLGSLAGHSVNTLNAPLQVTGVAGGVSDGDRFVYRSGLLQLQFEFNLIGDTGLDAGTDVVIPLRREDTYLEIGEKIVSAFVSTDFNLISPRALGDGTVHIGGREGDFLDTSASAITQDGTPGVTDSLVMTVREDFTGFAEGDQFTIRRAGAPILFELGFDRDVQPGAIPIRLVIGDTISVIADRIVNGIINANIGLTPVHEGAGVIRLNEPLGYELDLMGFAADPSTSPLTATGVPGGAVRVPVIPSPLLTPDGVAAQIVGALRKTTLTTRVFAPGGGSIWFERTSNISGLGSVPVSAIRDIAGNRLQPNRANEETQFTILMPLASSDYGDAPDSYNTMFADNGARNTLGTRGLPRLGLLIDSEADGQSAGSDDTGNLVVSIGGGAGVFGVPTPASSTINAFNLSVSSPSVADDGAQLILQSNGQLFVYELDSNNFTASPSFVRVPFTPGMPASELVRVLAERINATARIVAARAQGDSLLIYGGDEDGVPIGTFQARPGVAAVNGLFFNANGQFLSFLNPLDGPVEAAVITTGGGLLDAWIDFNQDGTFDGPGEQVLANEPVLDGLNRVIIATPGDAAVGMTWARFRLSRTGNQNADGVAITGEVEDYQVRVARIAPAVLADDPYTMSEDQELRADGITAPRVTSNDFIASLEPASVSVQLEDNVRFGSLTLSPDGSFVYRPAVNFYGTDSFTYRLFGLAELVPGNPSAGLLPFRSSTVATVTITVDPVNDDPYVIDKSREVLEDLPTGLHMTASELLVDAWPNRPTSPVTPAPWDESAQTLRITAIGNGTTSVAPSSPTGASTASVVTRQGILVTGNFFDGSLVDVLYQPANNYNFNNPLNPLDSLPSLDSFTFTITDNGFTVFPNGTTLTLPEESYVGTVTVTVNPVNDPPQFGFVARHTVLEDAGPQNLVAVTSLLPGPFNANDESPERVTFAMVPADTTLASRLFAVAPQIIQGTVDPTVARLTFETNPHQNGTIVYTVTATDNGNNNPAIGDDPVADSFQVTITVTPVNDRPEFNGIAAINVLEDTGPHSLPYASGMLAGPPAATDESGQTLVFDVVSARAPGDTSWRDIIPTLPTISPTTGRISFSTVGDAVGTEVFVVTLRDNGGTTNGGLNVSSPPRSVTIHVRPVNDAPSLVNPDPVVYSTREDTAIIIPVVDGSGQSLLDRFRVGPPNEGPGTTPGGNQSLSLVNFGSRRTAHGTVETILSGGVVTHLRYTPDLDYNSGPTGAVGDQIFITIADNGTTYNLSTGVLGPNPLTTDFVIGMVVEPVNDAPSFSTLTRNVRRLEDVGSVTIGGFATNIVAGPVTAGDERDPVTGQTMSFNLVAAPGYTETDVSTLFSQRPSISPTGTLTFTSAPNAVGTVLMVATLVDSGASNPVRGDVNTSAPATLTFTLGPVNDAPIANPSIINYALDEDRSITIPLTNGSGTGLYDIFTAGPANEGPGSTVPGGNQTFATDSSLYPSTTTGGGRIEPIFVGGQLSGLRYTPALDFNGTDSFIYGVRDNGQSLNLSNGLLFDDFKVSYATVSLSIQAVNDRPQFAGGVDVTVLEDAGDGDSAVPPSEIGLSRINQWATNILAGPPTATDESAQSLNFEIRYLEALSGRPLDSLFTKMNASDPSALPQVDPATGQLRFKTKADANGRAFFEVILRDNGPSGFVNGDPARPEHLNASVPRTFAIDVQAVNDPPTFVPGGVITVAEDSGPFSSVWATSISPGPSDEVAAGQAVLFTVVLAAGDQAKFSAPPTISDSGILRFTPADNAFTLPASPIVATVVAEDTAGGKRLPGIPLTINIEPRNDAPIAADFAFSSREDDLLSIPSSVILAGATDYDLPELDQLFIHSVSGTSALGATVTITSSGAIIQYDPRNAPRVQALAEGQRAQDIFTYQVRDLAELTSLPATITINLTGVNDPPRANDDPVAVQPRVAVTFEPLKNDFDIDGTLNPTSIIVTLDPAYGSLSVSSSGFMTYTPFDSFPGADLIRYRVRDDRGALSNEATVRLVLSNAPLAEDDPIITYRDEAISFDPLENDSDPDPSGGLDPSTIEILTEPRNGSYVLASSGIITYQPRTGFVGIDTMVYRVKDTSGLISNPATIRINVLSSRLQNPANALDVNASGQVSPIDALLIINLLNRKAPPQPIGPYLPGPPFYDVNGDLQITPIDALLVINALNRGQASGEGEAPPATESPAFSGASTQWLGLAIDRQDLTINFDHHLLDHCVPSSFSAASSLRASFFDTAAARAAVSSVNPLENDLDELSATIARQSTRTSADLVWVEIGAQDDDDFDWMD